MEPSDRKQLAQAIAVTAELTGTQLSEAALKAMINGLEEHPLDRVVAALKRCQYELGAGRFCFPEILKRMPGAHLSADEAWALYPKDEYTTAVVTREMHGAMDAARPLLEEGDKIAARMTFKQAYERLVSEACGRLPVWEITLGFDKQGRYDAVLKAVEHGRITVDQAIAALPDRAPDLRYALKLPGHDGKALPPPQPALGITELTRMAKERGALPAPDASQ